MFLVCRCWRMAAAWAVMIVAGSGLMLALKLYFEACGPARHRVLYSPSGHTMAATMVYGGLLSLTRLNRAALLAATLAIAMLMGWTRVALGYQYGNGGRGGRRAGPCDGGVFRHPDAGVAKAVPPGPVHPVCPRACGDIHARMASQYRKQDTVRIAVVFFAMGM